MTLNSFVPDHYITGIFDLRITKVLRFVFSYKKCIFYRKIQFDESNIPL